MDLVELRKVAHHGALRMSVGVVKEDPSAQDRDQAEDRLEERGLAGAVGADDANHLPGPDSKADSVDGGLVSVSRRQILNLEAVVPWAPGAYCPALRFRTPHTFIRIHFSALTIWVTLCRSMLM